MISQANLLEMLAKTNYKRHQLPYSAKYTQHTYFDSKKQEMDEMIKQLDTLNKATTTGDMVIAFSADLETKYKAMVMVAETAPAGNINREGTADLTKAKRIDYDSYLTYNENEVITAPSIITGFLTPAASGFNILLYGNKNPESFYKALLVLSTPEFMIKNKYERNTEVLRIKKEMAFAVKKLYNSGKYNLLCNGLSARNGFVKDTMIHNLLNRENYVDMPICQIACDMFTKNIIIFDLAKKSYELYMTGPFDAILTGSVDLHSHFRQCSWFVMVQYQGAYLPVFCVDIKHLFRGEHIMTKLMADYEWTNPDLYVNKKCVVVPPACAVVVVAGGTNPGSSKADEPIVAIIKDTEQQPIVTPAIVTPAIVTPAIVTPAIITPAIVTPAIITPAIITPAIVTPAVKPAQLKPVTSYLLAELQQMAEDKGITHRKLTTKGTTTNKTKQELYDELLLVK